MSDFCATATIRIARKEHPCTCCPDPIKRGAFHHHQNGYGDGGWWQARFHTGCWELAGTAEMRDRCYEEGLGDEDIPELLASEDASFINAYVTESAERSRLHQLRARWLEEP